MGQQQLLLIVLGVIIVGIAVVVGINVFTAQSEESVKDAIISDCVNLAASAHQYWRKPTEMGGGGRSFAGWNIPPGLDTTANGIFNISVVGHDDGLQITGTPFASTGYNWFIRTNIFPNDFSSSVIINP
ncbi:hypothetical protein ACFLR4_01710 [Bacteroidota bacterium]